MWVAVGEVLWGSLQKISKEPCPDFINYAGLFTLAALGLSGCGYFCVLIKKGPTEELFSLDRATGGLWMEPFN
jgi:hypothetical protein